MRHQIQGDNSPLIINPKDDFRAFRLANVKSPKNVVKVSEISQEQ